MATESVRIRYRPVRLGWCVREGNWDDLRSVLRAAHTLWGGAYGPILSIGGADHAAQLVRVYEVDALFPAAEDPELKAFAGRFSHLCWPSIHQSLFIQGSEGRGLATFLDLYHPVRSIYEEHFDGKQEPGVKAALYEWVARDPLEHVFLAQFGAYPSREEIAELARSMNRQSGETATVRRKLSVTGESVVERYCGHKAAAGSLAERRVLAATGEEDWLIKLLWKARDGCTIMPSWKSKKGDPGRQS